MIIRLQGKRSERGQEKISQKAVKNGQIFAPNGQNSRENEKKSVLTDKISAETDTFHEHYPNRRSAAGPGVFLFISRFLASELPTHNPCEGAADCRNAGGFSFNGYRDSSATGHRSRCPACYVFGDRYVLWHPFSSAFGMTTGSGVPLALSLGVGLTAAALRSRFAGYALTSIALPTTAYAPVSKQRHAPVSPAFALSTPCHALRYGSGWSSGAFATFRFRRRL